MVARYKIHPQSGYNFPVLLRASPAGQIALHSNYTTLHAHPGPLPPLPSPPPTPTSRDSFLSPRFPKRRSGSRVPLKNPRWMGAHVCTKRVSVPRRGRKEKRHARPTRTGDMPVSRKRIGVRLFFARSHLVRRKKAEPFRGEERRVEEMDTYVRTYEPHRAAEQFFPSFSSVRVSIERIFLPFERLSIQEGRGGEDTRPFVEE